MVMPHEMERLRAEHAALVTLSQFMLDMIAAPEPPRPTELAAVRGMLRDTLIRHLMCEDWALYPRLQAKGDPALNSLAKEFVDEMGHIADDFAAYDERWSSEAVAARWPDFCTETTGILDALAMRIEREECDLYPLAEKLAAPPPREGRRPRDGARVRRAAVSAESHTDTDCGPRERFATQVTGGSILSS